MPDTLPLKISSRCWVTRVLGAGGHFEERIRAGAATKARTAELEREIAQASTKLYCRRLKEDLVVANIKAHNHENF